MVPIGSDGPLIPWARVGPEVLGVKVLNVMPTLYLNNGYICSSVSAPDRRPWSKELKSAPAFPAPRLHPHPGT